LARTSSNLGADERAIDHDRLGDWVDVVVVGVVYQVALLLVENFFGLDWCKAQRVMGFVVDSFRERCRSSESGSGRLHRFVHSRWLF